VLLLNSCLTVEDGRPASHSNQGWEVLTDQIIRAVLASGAPVVFMLWGAYAQRMGLQAGLNDAVGSCLVLQANHPSPLSALRRPKPFLGCGHFSLANAFLRGQGCRPIRW
jgi:uracil-DNA glycosylase